ncbi:hypothetical protein P8452_00646 [Trifolium repens]|nr:hypothetical protein P8452_00646 [Trifolium repens]
MADFLSSITVIENNTNFKLEIRVYANNEDRPRRVDHVEPRKQLTIGSRRYQRLCSDVGTPVSVIFYFNEVKVYISTPKEFVTNNKFIAEMIETRIKIRKTKDMHTVLRIKIVHFFWKIVTADRRNLSTLTGSPRGHGNLSLPCTRVS